MEDGVADRALPATRAIEELDSMAGLRADGNRVDHRRVSVPGVGVPLIHVLVKYVRFLHGAVDEADADRIADVSAQHRRRRLAEQPGAVVLLFADYRPEQSPLADHPPQPALAVDHWLRAVADGHDRQLPDVLAAAAMLIAVGAPAAAAVIDGPKATDAVVVIQ